VKALPLAERRLRHVVVEPSSLLTGFPALMAKAVRFLRAGYYRILDAFSLKALTNVKRGTFREFQLYMVRWQTKHLA
jgi:hypothetical protein